MVRPCPAPEETCPASFIYYILYSKTTQKWSHITVRVTKFMQKTAILNYKLSRAQPSYIYSKAAEVLHNNLQTTWSAAYCPPGHTNEEDGAGKRMCNGIEPLHMLEEQFFLLFDDFYYVCTKVSSSHHRE